MSVFTRHSKWFILVLLLVFVVISAVVYADNIRNDVVAGLAPNGDTIIVDGSTTVGYRVQETGGDAGDTTGQNANRCNPSNGTPLTFTISVPAGVSASSSSFLPGTTSLRFTTCGTDQFVTFTSSSVGNYPITIVSIVDNGTGESASYTNHANFTLHVQAPPPPTDTTPPVISHSITGTLGNNDWYTTNVGITWSVTDPESTITSPACTDVNVTTDTAGTTFTCNATSAGGTSSQSVTIKRDATAPILTPSQSPAPNGAGWNNSNVTVSFTCSDNLSGIAVACVPNVVLTSEGANQTATSVAASDAAGNSATGTLSGIDIDKTAPIVSAAAAPLANAAGWNKTDVTVSFTCSDGLSGLAVACPSAITLTAEGVGQSAGSGLISDLAGNTASASVGNIKIDKTVPTISGSAAPAPNLAGWNNSPVTVSFDCDDTLSLIASCTTATVLSSDGVDQSVIGTAVDVAGNTATTTVGNIDIDRTVPFITGSRTPSANANGWNNTDVTVSFLCSAGGGSPVVSCTSDQIVGEGAAQSRTGYVMDEAGNTAQATVSNINVDKTAPTISGAPMEVANGNGWYNHDVTVDFVCSDPVPAGVIGVSGITPGTCEDALVTTEGTNQGASRTVSDLAGNTASASVTGLKIDKTAPTISGAPTEAANANGWYRNDVTVHFDCTDNLSGFDTDGCQSDIFVTGEGDNLSALGTATDKAGNSSTFNVTPIRIDRTNPVISVSVPPANGAGWYNVPVPVTFSCSDVLSGVDGVCGPDTILSVDGMNLSASGTVTDRAGNTASTSVTGINLDQVAPVVIGSRTPLANSDGWNNGAVTVSFECTDIGGSGIVPNSCPAPTILSGEGAGQSVYSDLVYDLADNSADATVSDINIDLTNPTITAAASPAANGFGWNNSNVTVTFTCNDALSGVKTCSSPAVLSSEGASQSASGTATDEAGNSASTTASGINIDKTAPVVTVTGVSNGAVYILGAVPVAACTTTDALSGVNVSATISTQETDGLINGVGSFTAICSGASDKAGNAGSASVNYTVTYNFSGFTAPVDNPPVVNTVRAGSAVPIKFGLGGNYGLNILQGNATVQRINCSTSAPTDAIETTVTAGNSSLSYDATTGLYTYVWKTARNLSGCYQFTLNLTDGTQRVAIFNFR